MIARGVSVPHGRVIRARALHELGETGEAIHDYLKAVQEDSFFEDEDLAEDLGLVDEPARRGPPAEFLDYVVDRMARPAIRLGDVPWLREAGNALRNWFVDPETPPEEREFSGGALLYGPPGCGKEEVCRALAGELGAQFVVIPIAELLGLSPEGAVARLTEIFGAARDRVPALVLFQELDALGARFTDMHGRTGHRVVKRFAQLLHGRRQDNRGVTVLASTNHPWHVDPWLRQQHLFDRLLFVAPPDLEERERLWQRLCKQHPIGKLKWKKLARRSVGCTGADIKGVIDLAVATHWAESMQSGMPSSLRTRHMLAALKECRRSVPSWLATARHYLRFDSNREAYVGVEEWLEREAGSDESPG